MLCNTVLIIRTSKEILLVKANILRKHDKMAQEVFSKILISIKPIIFIKNITFCLIEYKLQEHLNFFLEKNLTLYSPIRMLLVIACKAYIYNKFE